MVKSRFSKMRMLKKIFWLSLLATVLCASGCRSRDDAGLRAVTPVGARNVDLTKHVGSDEEGALKEMGYYSIEQAMEKMDYRNRRVIIQRREPWYSMPPVELIALIRYTGVLYGEINTALRSGDPQKIAKWQHTIQAIASALNRLPKHRNLVYRGSNPPMDVIRKYVHVWSRKKKVAELSFTSTSWGGVNASFLGKLLYIINSPDGRQIQDISSFEEEQEVLFAPGSEFYVEGFDLKKRDDTLSRYRIKLTEGEDTSPSVKVPVLDDLTKTEGEGSAFAATMGTAEPIGLTVLDDEGLRLAEDAPDDKEQKMFDRIQHWLAEHSDHLVVLRLRGSTELGTCYAKYRCYPTRDRVEVTMPRGEKVWVGSGQWVNGYLVVPYVEQARCGNFYLRSFSLNNEMLKVLKKSYCEVTDATAKTPAILNNFFWADGAYDWQPEK